ncbi:MAG TPA: penicillin acylase family protein, partial [Sphingobium sp.]
VAGLKANSSNNTLFADSKGEIAFLMPQFMPVRDDRFDYRRPVDGSDPATDWRGLHSLKSLPQAVNPTTGWAFNSNNWPWTAAGPDSPKAADYPRYFDQAGENPRGPQAIRVLTARDDFTPQTLIAAAFDTYLTAFARLVPQLVAAWDKLPEGDQQTATLAEPIGLLRGWDYRWGAESTATSLAVFWGEALWAPLAQAARDAGMSMWDYLAERATDAQRAELKALHAELEAAVGNREHFFAINERFHMQLLAIANNKWRDQMVADLRKVMKLNRHNSLLKAGRIAESLAEHRSVMAAIEARDAEAAMARMREHFQNGLEAAN